MILFVNNNSGVLFMPRRFVESVLVLTEIIFGDSKITRLVSKMSRTNGDN